MRTTMRNRGELHDYGVRQLGSTGTKVSGLCFGTWRFGKETDGTVETDREAAHDLLDTAWENGVNFIDIAGPRPASCRM